MKGLNIAFRTDASTQIGTGHVMRCLTLAEAFKEKGAKCHFISRAHDGNMFNQITKRGFEVIGLTNGESSINNEQKSDDYSKWLGVDWSIDAEETKGLIENKGIDLLIADHYALDFLWEARIRDCCERLMVIDDLADRLHDCDILVDQNLGRIDSDYKRLVPKNCKLFLGPKFAMLRPEFASYREKSLLRRKERLKFENLLISMGGVDKENYTSLVLNAILNLPIPSKFKITVVIGHGSPWKNEISEVSKKITCNIEIKENVNNMAELMLDADLAIGAAGSTSWERCCMGLPSLVLILANNQENIAQQLQLSGAAKLINKVNLKDDLRNIFSEIQASMFVLSKMSQSASKITDGLGVANILSNLNLRLQ